MQGQPHILELPLVSAAVPRISRILFFAAVLLYGGLILFLPLNSPADIYNSPDELANAFFMQGIADDGRVARPVLQADLPASVAPRSMLRSGDAFVPVGFVSFPILTGLFAKAVTLKGVAWVSAFIAMLGLLGWYGFLRSIFGEKVALITVFLTAAHPFILYWAARPFLPNIWFLSSVFLTFYFITLAMRLPYGSLPRQQEVYLEDPVVRQPKVQRYFYSILGGITFGLAVSLRPQEGIWFVLVPLYFLFVKRLRRRVALVLFAVAALIPIGSLLLLQNDLYGSPIHTGYHLTPLTRGAFSMLRNLIIPFGIDMRQIGVVVYHYWLGFIWWFAVMALLGIVFSVLHRDGKLFKRFRFWIAGFLFIASWLIIFYGSFLIKDRFDGSPSIGTSFTRYFLPLYAVALPFAALALFRLRAQAGRIIVSIVVIAGIILSLRLSIWATDESLARIPAVLEQNSDIRDSALDILPVEAVILTDRADKIFFPYREVVTRFRGFHQPDFEELYGLNLYYETIADKDVVEFENEYYWGPHRLRAVEPVDIGYRHTLYKLILLEKDDSIPKLNSPDSPY